MRENTFGKFFSIPFVLLSMPLLGIGLLIRYGLDDTCDILDNFIKVLKEKNQ